MPELVYTILLINALTTVLSMAFKDMLEFWRSAEDSLHVCISAHFPTAAERSLVRCSFPPSCTGRNQAGSSPEPSHMEGRPSDHTLYLETLHFPEKLLLTLKVAPSGSGHELCQHLAAWSAGNLSPSGSHVSYLITGQEKCLCP